MNKIIWIVVLIIVLVGGFFLFRDGTEAPLDNMENTGADANTPLSETDTETTGEVKEFSVEGGAFYFTPSTIEVNQGDTVRIVFTNAGGTHDWVIDEFNARTPIIQTGQTETIEFVADQAGTFEYYCSVGNHRAMGMVGTLIVN